MRVLFAAGAMLAASVAAASAAVVTTTPVTLSFGPQQTDFNTSMVFSQFDPSLYGGASLNSVHITLSGTATSAGGSLICLIPGSGGTCDATLSSQITMTLSTVPAGVLSVVIPAFSYSAPAFTGTVSVPANTNTDSVTDVYCAIGVPGCTMLAPAVMSLFSGTGTITLDLFADGLVTTINNNGTAAGSQPLDGSGSVTIYYDYIIADLPEPASLAILGLGTLGLVAMRRRRQ